MNAGTLRALEFDRIVAAVADLAVTPSGHERLLELHPLTDPAQVAAAQRATSEGTRLLADIPGFPLRAPSDLAEALDALSVEGRPLEPLRLLGLADYLESIDASRTTVKRATGSFPILTGLVDSIASFRNEIADVRRRIEPSGEVADHASPALARIRDRLRKLRARLRSTLDALVRGRETAKYLQDQVVTDRNGRYVVMVRAEHRGAIPGLVHGASSSGATLYLEPLDTVEFNNDVVALQEEEAGEVRRILLELSDAFRGRPLDLRRTLDVATELDAIQARARFSVRLGGVEPAMSTDGTLDLRAARHPLLVLQARERRAGRADAEDVSSKNDSRPQFPVPVDIRLIPPVHILIIAGPNTGGKTVALKTAGLLALMAQAGLHVPADPGSRTPVFQAVFADIGDEQSIAASLSTFSAHITNVVSMDRMLRRPALILLDEVGAGTDPVEGGALGTAVIDHFRGRGAHLVATTHYDALKSYASTTAGVTGAAFGFDPDTFAPTYRLIYGSPGRSLAIEIAARLGMPSSVVQAARANMSDREQQLAEHLARVDRDLHAVEQERQTLARERATVAETERKLRAREEALREREAVVRRRAETRLDQQLRDARREIDAVLEGLKVRASELREARLSGIARTSEAGAARADARSAVDRAIEHARHAAVPEQVPAFAEASPAARGPIVAGTRVRVGSLGMEGTVIDLHGRHAEVEVRGKRLRARADDLSPLAPAAAPPVKIRVDLQPRESSLSELNVIGCTVDEALDRVEKFLDEATVTDQRSIRIVHGHGTGQLRRGIAGFLKEHPLVARFETAPTEQGGGGVTVVELKD